MDPAGVPALSEAIELLFGCKSKHVATEHVREVGSDGEVAWEGDVEVFEAAVAPNSVRFYAWSEATPDGDRRCIAVMDAGRVNSAAAAVHTSNLDRLRTA